MSLLDREKKCSQHKFVTNINLGSDSEDPNDVYSVKGEREKCLAREKNKTDRNKVLLGGFEQISVNETSAQEPSQEFSLAETEILKRIQGSAGL